MAALSSPSFRRDRLTWLTYFSISAYAFYVYALGPVVSLLRTELHLSYTLASLHSTLWAVGAVATGLGFDVLSRRLGRRLLLWLSALVTAAGAVLFALAHEVALTLPATAILAVGSSTLGAVSATLIADHHGGQRDRALLEANAGASGTGIAVPALLGLLAGTVAGWRPGLLVPVVTLAALFAVYRRLPLPAPVATAASARRLPRSFWPACLLVAFAVAIEFAILFYAVPLLGAGSGIPTDRAAAILSVFLVGELSGRLAGARLTRRSGRGEAVVAVSLALTLAGFLVLWLGRTAPLQGVALYATGAGVGNLYPISLALAFRASQGLNDRAMARTQIAIAIAIGTAPVLLGALSDRFGVLRALAVEPALIAGAAVLLFVVRGRPAGGAVPT